ncbi:hypothetical protein HOY80DRAFT_1047807 [Tuber brumale]|nr:hypothetical protein HOY80DRAFT_1057897 [Tuber brumale]KAG0638396.1 hypothetical protein HOY80DRAFT_1047807 [Tuber brumale]
MPSIPHFTIKTLLFQFNKRDHMQNQGGDDSDAKSPVVVGGLVVASLTLLVAMVPLFRSQRFHGWLSSFSIPSLVKFHNPGQKFLRVITLPNPPSTATAAKDGMSAIPAAETPTPATAPIHNDCSNTPPTSNHSNTSLHCNNVIAEDGSVRQVEESTGPRRPEPVVAREFVSR